MKAVGLLLAVGSLVVGLVLVGVGLLRPGATIDNFARGNLGCTTELDVDAAGEYWVFVERHPEPVTGLGDCSPAYDGDADVTVTITGPAGTVALEDRVSQSYSRDGRDASSLGKVSLDEPGTYELVASGAEENSVVAIGPHPDSGRMTFVAFGAAIAAIGLGVGLLILVRASRRSTPQVADTATAAVASIPAPPVPPSAPADPSVWAPRPASVDWSPPDPSGRRD